MSTLLQAPDYPAQFQPYQEAYKTAWQNGFNDIKEQRENLSLLMTLVSTVALSVFALIMEAPALLIFPIALGCFVFWEMARFIYTVISPNPYKPIGEALQNKAFPTFLVKHYSTNLPEPAFLLRDFEIYRKQTLPQ